ncbi:hypothetical protein PYW08_004930 [Mythimna loreyi]|uniref:Uncharacterized protein n=1 Tax=Mythimna loreyi TaxID=667449 RepID=A0ACC2QG49_9NEOP|nr:hypothetical protein PYW08_004930 [Mythimna loreyi]
MRLLIVVCLLCAVLGQNYVSSYKRHTIHRPRTITIHRPRIITTHHTVPYYTTSRPKPFTRPPYIQRETHVSHINKTRAPPIERLAVQEKVHAEEAHRIPTRRNSTTGSDPGHRNSSGVRHIENSSVIKHDSLKTSQPAWTPDNRQINSTNVRGQRSVNQNNSMNSVYNGFTGATFDKIFSEGPKGPLLTKNFSTNIFNTNLAGTTFNTAFNNSWPKVQNGKNFSTNNFNTDWTVTSGNSGNVQYTQQTNNQIKYVSQNNYSPKTVIYYRPPQQIIYGHSQHPVYQGPLPPYVFEYQNSGSKYNNLLTGLALYNLGRYSKRNHGSYTPYTSAFGEVCKLRISDRGRYDETRINCDLMSSFILESSTGTAWNSQFMTVTNLEDALKIKGPPVEVTTSMNCSVIRTTLGSFSVMEKSVDCGLLQEYARSSFHRNDAQFLMPIKTIIFNLLIILYLVRY